MFGMGDAGQVLVQLERYLADGREEITEVMARDLVQQLRAKRGRDVTEQVHLVKALRLLSDVLLLRGKVKDGAAEVRRLHRERRALERTVRRADPALLERLTPAAEDHLRSLRAAAALGRSGGARKALKRIGRTRPGHLLAHVEAVERLGDVAGLGRRLGDAAHAARPIQQTEQGLHLVPASAPESAVDLARVEAALASCKDSRASEVHALLQAEGASLRNKEAEAQAKLQAAIASLEPTHDYYEYG
ncbi:MAG: hypothetical protein QF839_00250 [Candidatus Poseidoniaceae archaeon]|nr:hypothetical protein [Candidatus Poseidoniaceae archaeon]